MDNVNSVGDFIRGVFSTLVNKDDEIFKALFASSDNGSPGTVEKIFGDLEETRDKWCNTPDVYEQAEEMLEKTLSFFSFLSRTYEESDASFKERNRLLYIRDGDTIWGDRWDIIKLFKSYFKTEFVYIVNDTDDKNNNLLSDGDFEEQNGAWALDSCDYSQEARFSERFGLHFDNYGKCCQTVSCIQPDSTYFLHFFQNGNLDAEIKDNNGRYWKPPDPCIDEFGSWVDVPYKIRITVVPGKWEPRSVFFLTDQSVSGVTISFMGINGEETYLDYVRLFKKDSYSTFTLIAVLGHLSTNETMKMAPGEDDPVDVPEVDYSKMSYIEQANLSGIAGGQHESIYTELLETVRAGGIPPYIEILIRE